VKRNVLLLLFLCVASNADELPLFASDAPLDIVLEFPLDVILRQADENPVVKGHVSYSDDTGNQVSIPVKVSTRGRSRLGMCRFPPLSLTMDKKRSKGTVFEGQNKKLKIVTHCKTSVAFRQYLFQEYSIYKAFNTLTDLSFRSRFLNMTYRNTDGSRRDIVEPAFLIESIYEVADRNDAKRQKVSKIRVAQLDPEYTILTALFQFMIGNTDWSVTDGSVEDGCCHNTKPLSPHGSATGWYVVPFDFDQAGLINARYAVPAAPLPIKSVRQRMFRGRCVHMDQIEQAIAMFNERRQQLENALIPPGGKANKSTASYIDSFYAIINDPQRRLKYIEKSCVK
jgi:hypothetical protein